MERTGYNTPAALARATGITDTTIGRWIKGEKLPTIPNLRAVAPVLKVRLGDMMVQAGLATAAELGQTVAPLAAAAARRPRHPYPPRPEQPTERAAEATPDPHARGGR